MSIQLADYVGRITSEHRDKPKFVAYVGTGAGLPVDARNLLQQMPDDFDVDVAVGVQLDTCGAWVGCSREIVVQSSEAYPAAEPYLVVLDDDIFRRLIKARALANRWDGTPEGIGPILAAFYGPAGTYAAVFDNQDMSIDLYLTGTRPTAVEAAVLSQFILPVRPSTVRVKNTHVGPTGGPIFGLDYDNHFISGPDVGSFAEAF